jgi:DNA-binding transcriptional LysR family regulator
MSFDDRLLNGVSALAAVVRSGGFAAAARSLNVSQPGISRAVARLEAQVGIRLLERTTRSVSLTDEGRRFYETIGPIVSALEDATSALAEGKVTSTWTLTSRSSFSDRNSVDFSKHIRSLRWT